MARLNLEERFFAEGRLFRLARSLGLPVQTVVGMLAFLWHDSQEIGEFKGDATSICDWMRLHEIQTTQVLNREWEIDKLEKDVIESLINCRYISEIEPGIYEIHGNREQLEKLDKWAERAKKAANARWGATSNATSNANAMLKHMQSDALQFNSIQDNSTQDNSISVRGKKREKKSQSPKPTVKPEEPATPLAPSGDQQTKAIGVPKPKKPEGKDIAQFIARYVEAYEERYGARPVLDGISRGEAIRLVEGSGVTKACELVTAYLQLSDKVFLAKCHDLTSLRMNVNRVSVALQTGREDPAKDLANLKWEREFLRRSGDDQASLPNGNETP